MADGFDPCECVWNHEHAMQRLINLVSAYCRFFFYPFFSCPSVQALNDPWTVHPFSEIEPGSNSSIYIHVALAFMFHRSIKVGKQYRIANYNNWNFIRVLPFYMHQCVQQSKAIYSLNEGENDWWQRVINLRSFAFMIKWDLMYGTVCHIISKTNIWFRSFRRSAEKQSSSMHNLQRIMTPKGIYRLINQLDNWKTSFCRVK